MKDRHIELSGMFMEMGNALVKEGKENNDYSVTQSGNIMIMISGLLYNEKDIASFSDLCSMFSAKKVLENIEATQSDFSDFMKNKSQNETYEEYIIRIKKLRGDNK